MHPQRIKALASREGVKAVAVENFLSTLSGTKADALANLEADARSYKWTAATKTAIFMGIIEHFFFGAANPRGRKV